VRTEKKDRDLLQIVVVGLGYVGLPLAVEFGKKYTTVGVDINEERIQELKEGFDRTRELNSEELTKSVKLSFTSAFKQSENKVVYIITVPTPIDVYKKPDLRPLISASRAVGKVLKQGDIVIYESTVYPGCTEEDCVPVLESESGLKYNLDFFCGYSPERINPGDKVHTVTKIRKVTSGSTPEVANVVDELYNSIVEAGTYKASSIKVAEAAKVIENCQRDINIAFVNELALIFDKMDIDTVEVLEAAGSKWNFLPFRPGLVGGHCIGVDPYYLTYKAESLGHHPEVILSGRRINDSMGQYVASQFIKQLIKSGKTINGLRLVVLGITFKENCPDIRNSKVIDIISELNEYGCEVDVYDPWAEEKEVKEEYGIDLADGLDLSSYEGALLAVSHDEFTQEAFIGKLRAYSGVVYDVKSVLPKELVSNRL
jgi:UDP-N-acetyl-D-galactosamine dehydrogenase